MRLIPSPEIINARKTSNTPSKPPSAAAKKNKPATTQPTVKRRKNSRLDPALLRPLLMDWYRLHARRLPWRGVTDPYHTWVSEIMLQQTRVAAVIAHYEDFLRRFPTLLALALAPEDEVLASWSGLGYYRRARMLHRAAQFVTSERGGVLPTSSAELRTLPGIGEYTSAAIASIAFGESIAVVDGNVERVLLRLTGRPESSTAECRAFVHQQAALLIPPAAPGPHNAPGDHNQAMMELGATICLPRAPLCIECPLYHLCCTRGEHPTPVRPAQRSLPASYLLSLRKREITTEVLLHQRPHDGSLMPGMYELPPLPEDAVAGFEPLLRLRHSITNTNYYAKVYAPAADDRILRRAVPAARQDLHWTPTRRLDSLPLTGLAKKVLRRLDVMTVKLPTLPANR